MTAQEFRDRVADMIKDKPVKVWLVRASGHRLDFLWSVGLPRASDGVTLARQGCHYIVGQDVPETMVPTLVAMFEEFCRSDEARKAEAAIRPLRFIPVR
ncbi:MAG: hypothetical protein KA248_12390 [Kiritimatiellae bacterium]|nr:hypothetical protein [Kiritimatiellia bacterium]